METLQEKRTAKIDAWLYEHDFRRIREDVLENKSRIEWYSSRGQMLILHIWPDDGWDVFVTIDDSGKIDPTIEALNHWVKKP